MKSFQVFIFLFVVIVSYETESVDGNVICTYNPCTFSPDLCINGGTCKSDANCKPVCECPSDFSGYRCEISNRNNSCTKKCSPETCNRKGYCTQDPLTCDFACDCFDGFAGGACNANIAINDTTSNPCYPLICVNGECNSTGARIQCVCKDQWTGDTCNIPCKRNCTRGTCAIRLNQEICICPGSFTSESNCTEELDITSPSPVKTAELAKPYLIFVIVFTIFLILTFVLLVYLMWRKRMIFVMKIVYYLQKYEDSDGKLYDAFISFRSSKSDEFWVLSTLLPTLENEMGFKVCVHFRDFLVGETISNNIIDAIEKSRRTILVLSPDYVNGEWTRMEYQVAQQEMLSLRHKIIPIIFRDIGDMKLIDKNLKLILNAITYIKWPTTQKNKEKEKFWQQLRLTMPKKHEVKTTIKGGDVINEWSADTRL